MPFKQKYCEMQAVDSTCKKEIYSFTVKEPLHHCQWVQQCPEDKTKVMPWDEKDPQCRIGYVKCPLALVDCPYLWLQEGDCVDIVIHREWGGKEVSCITAGFYCDESVPPQLVWYTLDAKGNETFTKAPNSDEVIEVVGCLKPYELGDLNPEPKELIISTRKITLVEGVETNLSPIPDGAVGAEVVFEGESCCVFRATWDGSPATNGPKLTDADCINLGCTNEAQSDEIELTNFKVIAEDDCEGCIRVSFYKQS